MAKSKKNIEAEEIKNEGFELKEPVVETNDEITAADFKLANTTINRHDQKLETKPTTFFKDALRRFRKNKSSVVATWILGILILLAIFVPVIDQNDVKGSHPDMGYLEPKLFESGTGWWDGCTSYKDIVIDQSTGLPAGYKPSAVSNVVLKEKEYINTVNDYGVGGYVQIYNDKISTDVALFNNVFDQTFSFKLADTNKVTFSMHEDTFEDYVMSKYSIKFTYTVGDGTQTVNELYLVENSSNYSDVTFDVTAAVKAQLKEQGRTADKIGKYSFEVQLKDVGVTEKFTQLFVKSITFTTTSTSSSFANVWNAAGFSDANAMLNNPNFGAVNYWGVKGGTRAAYKVVIQKCSFTYDTYEAAFGNVEREIGKSELQTYCDKGWCSFDFNKHGQEAIDSFKVLDEKCPIVEILSIKESSFKGKIIWNATVTITYYKYIGYTSMPKFLMGTDKNGKDMLKYVFEGLRTSLIMGVITAAICFTFGLCWGAFSGYFGGNVDLAMERFTDILSGMPWIVVMTLCIVHLGQTFFVFVLALCLTGWIGTAATTRTQFYRFKGREYVLASRTLGASDTRLIFRHILPNAMGTIITGAVLMIPGVIFSEATISYLGLGLKGLSSLGVILSNNQGEIHDHVYLLVFPSVIIALLMICFNLFGNGLRDAINPSLKGEGE